MGYIIVPLFFIISFSIFYTSNRRIYYTDLYQIFRICRRLGGLIIRSSLKGRYPHYLVIYIGLRFQIESSSGCVC